LEIKDFDDIPLRIAEQVQDQLLEQKKEVIAEPIKLLRNSVKLGMMLAGKNISGFENKTIRLASPRFFGIVPEDVSNDETRLLSPSLFNLHEEGDEVEKLFSIPSFIRAVKSIKIGDHEDLLDFIFEAAGVTDALDSAKEKLKQKGETVNTARGIDGQPLYFTKSNVTELYGDVEERKIDTFETLYKSLTPEQVRRF
uniref:DEAD/DEAH box helicase n=1 Tax=Gongylonema pulchrum TaxID=637853 RepID=A0A183D3Y8_9BILA